MITPRIQSSLPPLAAINPARRQHHRIVGPAEWPLTKMRAVSPNSSGMAVQPSRRRRPTKAGYFTAD
jgi:hypothetical protein